MRYLSLIAFKMLIGSILFGSTLYGAALQHANMKNLAKEMPHLTMPISNEDSIRNISDSILPKSLTTADSSRTVVSKIIDNSLAYWWNNSEFKNTSVGRAATTIEKNMKADLDLGTTSNSMSNSKTDHKISFKVLAMQALAKLEYKGWFAGAINYDVKAATAQAEVLENLSNNKDLVISHSISANENKSQLSLRWKW